MVKVKMKTLSAGPAGVRQPGAVVEVDDAEGTALVAGGYADAVDAPVKKVAKPAGKTRKAEETNTDDADTSPTDGESGE